jgi:hypothetical protein
VAILSLDVYRGFGPTLASEYWAKKHGIHVSRETVRKWMKESGLWKGKRWRTEEAHLWRPRRSRFGELVQWYTSEHDWLEGRGSEQLYLISMIDDDTSRLYARFVKSDSTEEIMRTLWGYVELYGRPLAFYTDKASLFRNNEKRRRDEPGVDQDTAEMPPTQIGRALRELDMLWIAGAQPPGEGLRFILHLLRTADDILWKASPFGEPDALRFARWVGSWILIQPVVSIVHRIAAKQATIPPGDHALGADVQSFRHFFECQ